MSARFIEGLETRQFLSGGPAGGPGTNGSNGANGNPTGDVVQLRKHDRLHDGTCQTATKAGTRTGAGDKQQLRLRDGSCVV